jgi:hypothetical protein
MSLHWSAEAVEAHRRQDFYFKRFRGRHDRRYSPPETSRGIIAHATERATICSGSQRRKLAESLPCGVMVTQRPLEALFLVRVQAGQPIQTPSNQRTASEIQRNLSNLHWRIETHKNAPKRSLFVSYSSKVSTASMGFRTFSDLELFRRIHPQRAFYQTHPRLAP